LQASNSNYELFLDGESQSSAMLNSIYNITVVDDSILVSIELMPIKKVRELVIKSNLNCNFKIKPSEPPLPQRNLENTISIISKNCFLNITNEVDLDNYVAGVVEAEVGSRQPFEYYKVQATICRTYVLAHLRKHEKDGFNMCDKEHCQVFKGKSLSNIDIINAVQETSNSVLVDENLNLIVAAFHSNCGGQTVSSADVWNKAQSYLQPIRDTFCVNSRNAHWEKEVNKKIWIKYLLKRNTQLDSSNLVRNYNFAQPQRTKDFIVKDIKIPLKEIRSDFNLKSTYFSVEDAGETLIFKGKGFGHGIGLCQEGAIRMAKTGYSYSDIIHYYFKNVNIVNLNSLYFFKDVE
jgi:stage II sporulation protein D